MLFVVRIMRKKKINYKFKGAERFNVNAGGEGKGKG
jgi:hypothetical protein